MGTSEAASRIDDVRAEAHLVARFEPRVRRVARARVHPDWVDDVVNEVLGAVVEAVRDDRVEDPDRLPGFVYGVTRNVISNWARAQARDRRATEDGLEPAREISDPLQLLLDEETRASVVRCLESLRDEDREILHMSFYRGLTPTEVANETGIAPNVARQRLWRARERFKAKWQARDAM
ncbi:MAG: sigma-70 family RNA polymerase sigma factor [Gemmatimonadetes bacterium]|nr:sigma-70 family RNA polymerase sigma factor [Gemmatimonadota bacterium]